MTNVDDLSRKHLMIEGRVQGVGYRYSLRQKAQSLSVTGWCRNLPDGHVEAELYGEPSPVEDLIQWCYQGPPDAEVTHIHIQSLPLDGGQVPDNFEIRTHDALF